MMLLKDFCLNKDLRKLSHLPKVKSPFEVKEGDEIWWYCSVDEQWKEGLGSEGYVLVRNGEIIDSRTLRMN